MEQNGSNQNMPSTSLCIRGCGFYGSPAFDGMCSKCHKDAVKRRQHNPSPSGLISPSPASLAPSEPKESTSSSSSKSSSTTALETNTTPSVETASPTVPSVAAAASAKDTESSESSSSTSTDATAAASDTSGRDSPADKDKKPKKNRCHTCKKKVGLTGFQCRCGGLYCGLHRYSDKHDCTFDYKELAQEEIRKANPVVVGAKVQKI